MGKKKVIRIVTKITKVGRCLITGILCFFPPIFNKDFPFGKRNMHSTPNEDRRDLEFNHLRNIFE